MDLKTFKKRLLENPGFRKEYYNKKDLHFEISEMLIDARVEKGLTQEKLAKLVGTKQSSIARLENGSGLPSLSFLQKIAEALGTYLIPPKFAFLENEKTNTVEGVMIIPCVGGEKQIDAREVVYNTLNKKN